ncbi:hypothetical protein [Pseudoalteromonas umbrosa]|uniref:hypothetical protein n=1 Tax=Pseudoalteromonas umbrosa TaxID=3048489 RepID=UPI0024C2E152|nr:hypothetical protein [Pseudoalteromonas sp. B95]MDK1289774.1 hypothetical protein [Pseudoalteromonas sp. B95]
MTWFNSANSNATSGSNVIKINDNQSVANVRANDALVLGSFAPVEISNAYATTHGTFIELKKPWPNATQSQVPCVVLPTSGDFNTAVSALNSASKMVNDNYKSMVDWQTKTGTVQFRDLEGNTQTVKTLRQMQSEIDISNPFPWAMRKVEFEARRQQNLERYTASGFVNHGLHIDANVNPAVGNGLWTWPGSPNQMSIGVAETDSGGQGKSRTKHATLNVSGVLFDLKRICHVNYVFLKLPPTEDGTRTYDSDTGITVTHSSSAIAFASENGTNKVVTDPVNMWGFEAFLREINDDDPFVYANGLIQSRATNIDGVTTTDDTIRPNSYFSWYSGDETSRGRGVNWQIASEAQRMRIGSNPENLIYFDDLNGKFYQWCIRGCSYTGVGNGDWDFIDSTVAIPLSQKAGNGTRVPVQGSGNTPQETRTGARFFASSALHAHNPKSRRGIFTAKTDDDCFFIVCGTVSRLNTGIYHPSHNPLGSSLPRDGETYDQTSVALTNKADCFEQANILTGSGAIASGKSGRPDGRFYDAIYEDGEGGVCRDMRYNSQSLTAEEIAETDLQVKLGHYRGIEQPLFVRFLTAQPFYYGSSNTSNLYFRAGQNNTGDLINFESLGFKVGSSVIIHQPATNYVGYGSLHEVAGHIELRSNRSNIIDKLPGSYSGQLNKTDPCYIMKADPMPSLAGEFCHTDVAVTDPATVLQCSALRGGWIGSWVPTRSNGAPKKIHWSRPVGRGEVSITGNLGASWVAGDAALWFGDIDNNSSLPVTVSEGQIIMATYKTAAAMTEQTEKSKVFGAAKGVGGVCVVGAHNKLAFSLCEQLPEQSQPIRSRSFQVSGFEFSEDSKIESVQHPQFNLAGAASDVAIKVLNYTIEQNGQLFIGYEYESINHDGNRWLDSGEMSFDGNSSNANRVSKGSSILTEAIGWV